jgi:hypothetical protein
MEQAVFFDTQIITRVSDGAIPAAMWEEVIEKLARKYKYRVSFTTFIEVVNALAGGDEPHFEQNRKRLLVLTDVDGCEFLPMPAQFLRTAVLGLPSERPEFSPKQLKEVWMPVIRGAQRKEDLSLGNVVMASLPGDVDLTAGIDLAMVRRQMEDGKKLWGEQLGLAKNEGKGMPPPDLYAAFILAFDAHAPQSPENVVRVSRALDAPYCHLAHIHLESTKGAYKFEGKLQDWIDNQQLMYLADPDLTFVTADRKLIAKLGKSLDRHRVREFEEFVKAL